MMLLQDPLEMQRLRVKSVFYQTLWTFFKLKLKIIFLKDISPLLPSMKFYMEQQ